MKALCEMQEGVSDRSAFLHPWTKSSAVYPPAPGRNLDIGVSGRTVIAHDDIDARQCLRRRRSDLALAENAMPSATTETNAASGKSDVLEGFVGRLPEHGEHQADIGLRCRFQKREIALRKAPKEDELLNCM
jgi:hypothetical protein